MNHIQRHIWPQSKCNQWPHAASWETSSCSPHTRCMQTAWVLPAQCPREPHSLTTCTPISSSFTISSLDYCSGLLTSLLILALPTLSSLLSLARMVPSKPARLCHSQAQKPSHFLQSSRKNSSGSLQAPTGSIPLLLWPHLLLQPSPWPPCCFPKPPGMFLLRSGLRTSCSPNLEQPCSKHPQASLPPFPQIFPITLFKMPSHPPPQAVRTSLPHYFWPWHSSSYNCCT